MLIPLANDGLLLWESMRRCPEGLSAALVSSQEARDTLIKFASVLDIVEKPEIAVTEEILPIEQQADEWFSSPQFEHILIRCARPAVQPKQLAVSAKPLLVKDGNLILLTSPPILGERISRVLLEECGGSAELAGRLRQAEDAFFKGGAGVEIAGAAWDSGGVRAAFEEQGFVVNTETLDQGEERLINEKDLASWFDTDHSRWGAFMGGNLEKSDFSAIREALTIRIQKGPVLWRWKSLFLTAKK